MTAAGVAADVVNAAEADPDPSAYDGLVVAASVHAGRFQSTVVQWVRTHAPVLAERPSAFLSVCLGILEKDPRALQELGSIVQRFQDATGWIPETVKLVAGAVRFTRYGWIKRLIMRRIVRKAGGSTDTSRDHEYTDWDDPRRFVAGYLARCGAGAPREESKPPVDQPVA